MCVFICEWCVALLPSLHVPVVLKITPEIYWGGGPSNIQLENLCTFSFHTLLCVLFSMVQHLHNKPHQFDSNAQVVVTVRLPYKNKHTHMRPTNPSQYASYPGNPVCIDGFSTTPGIYVEERKIRRRCEQQQDGVHHTTITKICLACTAYGYPYMYELKTPGMYVCKTYLIVTKTIVKRNIHQ